MGFQLLAEIATSAATRNIGTIRGGFRKTEKIGSAFIFRLWRPLLHQLCLPLLRATHTGHRCALQTPVTTALPSRCPRTGCCPQPRSPPPDADLPSARHRSRLCQPDASVRALPHRAEQMLQPRKIRPLTCPKHRVKLVFKAASLYKNSNYC